MKAIFAAGGTAGGAAEYLRLDAGRNESRRGAWLVRVPDECLRRRPKAKGHVVERP